MKSFLIFVVHRLIECFFLLQKGTRASMENRSDDASNDLQAADCRHHRRENLPQVCTPNTLDYKIIHIRLLLLLLLYVWNIARITKKSVPEYLKKSFYIKKKDLYISSNIFFI